MAHMLQRLLGKPEGLEAGQYAVVEHEQIAGRAVRTVDEEFALWSAFVARVQINLPFRVGITLAKDEDGERVRMGVELHVLDRDTREPIKVHTRQHVAGPAIGWTNDEDAIGVVFGLLDIALKHEINEAVRLDGKLVRDTHAPVSP